MRARLTLRETRETSRPAQVTPSEQLEGSGPREQPDREHDAHRRLRYAGRVVNQRGGRPQGLMSDYEDKVRRLLHVGRALVGELDPEAVLHRILDEARELTGATP